MDKNINQGNLGRDFARKLLQIKAIRLNPQNPFQWASGWLSPIYCDNRIVLSYPDARKLAVLGLATIMHGWEKVDVVAGVATAGIAHGALLANHLGLPFVYVRGKRKEHGRQNLVEGHLEKGQRVLLVEDLISTGGSCLKAVEGIREAGGEVVGVLALFTYGFPVAQEAFQAYDCPLQTLSDYPTLLEVAVEDGYLKEEELHTLALWRENPQDWQP